jgi:uncharacterized protein (TIRG00374 family)
LKIKTLIKLIGLLILGFILWRIDFGELSRTLAQCRLSLVAASLLLMFVTTFIKAVRWQQMLLEQGLHYSVGKAFKRYLAGIFIGAVTPGRLGELSRALYVKRDLSAPIGLVFSSVIVDRIYDLYLLLIFGLAAGFGFHLAGTWSSVFLVVIALLFVGPIIFLHPVLGKRILNRLLLRFVKKKFHENSMNVTEDFFSGVEKLISWKAILFGLLTVAAFLAYFTAGYLLTISIGMGVRFTDVMLALALANMMSLLPITIAGVGTRDAVFVLTLGTLGIAAPSALAFSLLVLATSYLGLGVVGFAFFMADKPPKEVSD